MVRRLCLNFLLSLLGVNGLLAQVEVRLVDDATGHPLAYGRIDFGLLSDPILHTVVSDTLGRAVLQFPVGRNTEPFLVHVHYIGYGTRSDTITGTAPIIIRLQRKTIGLEALVVTGQYAPSTVDAAVHRVRVLDADQFRRMAANNLGDALRNELNIRLAQDNVLGSSMSMQGMGGQNVKILVDGIPVIGRQDGNIDLAQLDLTGIDRVEIVEGPLSVSYGTNALAGTINMITHKAGSSPASVKATVYAEHIGRLNTTVALTRQWGKHGLLINAGRNFFGGWDPGQQGLPSYTPAMADTSRFQQWKPREQYFGRLNYRWSTAHWTLGYKGEFMHDMILSRGMPRAPYYTSAFDERYTTVRLDNAISAEGRYARGRRVTTFLAHNRYSRTRNTWYKDLTTLEEELIQAAGTQDTTAFQLTDLRAVYASAPDSSRSTWESGIDLARETATGARIDQGLRAIGDYAAFASLEYKPIDRLTVRPGVRYAYNTRYQAPVIPSVNLRWRIADAFTLRASYAEGFRAPSLKELYFFFVDVNHDILGNPDLRPERSQHATLAIGYRQAAEKNVVTAEVSLFHNRIHDLITLAQLNGSSFAYTNVGYLRTAGGSVGAGWEDGRWAVSCGASLTARLDDIALQHDEPWLLIPELRGSLTRQWAASGWSASVFWKYTGTQANYVAVNTVDVVRGSIAPYQMADANVSRRFWGGRITVVAGCKDLFNVQNLSASMAGGVHNAGASSVPMSTGRTLFLRVEMVFAKKKTE